MPREWLTHQHCSDGKTCNGAEKQPSRCLDGIIAKQVQPQQYRNDRYRNGQPQYRAPEPTVKRISRTIIKKTGKRHDERSTDQCLPTVDGEDMQFAPILTGKINRPCRIR